MSFWNETKSELQTFLCAVLLRGRWHWVSCSGKGTHYWQRAWSVIPGPGAGRVDSVTHLMNVKGTVSLLCIKMIHILISWMKCTQNTNVEQPYITQIMFLLNNKNNFSLLVLKNEVIWVISRHGSSISICWSCLSKVFGWSFATLSLMPVSDDLLVTENHTWLSFKQYPVISEIYITLCSFLWQVPPHLPHVRH